MVKAPSYRIKTKKTVLANGTICHFDLLRDGDWVASFPTEPEAEAEMKYWQEADLLRHRK